MRVSIPFEWPNQNRVQNFWLQNAKITVDSCSLRWHNENRVKMFKSETSPHVQSRFLPMIIDANHSARALELIKDELVCLDVCSPKDYVWAVRVDQGLVRSPSQLQLHRPRSELPPFDHKIGLRVISSLMSASVLKMFESHGTPDALTEEGVVGELVDEIMIHCCNLITIYFPY